MNVMSHSLPGLLDTFQFSIPDLPALGDFHIAPLRDPVPARSINVPLPLEPLTTSLHNNTRPPKNGRSPEDQSERRRGPQITPNDVLLAREAKKPHLAISELLEANNGRDITPTQLPSFISLSVVERSPVQAPTRLEHVQSHTQKRLKLDTDSDHVSNDSIRRLPRPAQIDDRQSRPAPLLPAMVTGLHEPPPSAALLPFIDVVTRPAAVRAATSSKIHVKDILTPADPEKSPRQPLSASSVPGADGTRSHLVQESQTTSPQEISPILPDSSTHFGPLRDSKPRRARRKWSEQETKDLLAGVTKYGVGKWKQILDDPAFTFCERSSVDLKDRYRVCANNDAVPKLTRPPSRTPSNDDLANVAQLATSQPALPGNGDEQAPPSPGEQLQPLKQRRKRRAWTATEDQNLLEGVVKHGFQWTLIHDDMELNLQHRRATDLRDRIRNRFPDGYKHADIAPLRSDLKKNEKNGVSTSSVPLLLDSGDNDLSTPSPSSIKTKLLSSNREVSTTPTNASLHSSLDQSRTGSATVNMMIHSSDVDTTPTIPSTSSTNNQKSDKDKDVEREREREKDQLPPPGVTLPSFSLDVDDDMDWDNRLPPMHEWDEIGI